jgi:signal peptidase I
MRKCPTCGFNNPDTRERCLKCSAALTTIAVPDGSGIADRPTPVFQPGIAFNRFQYWLGKKFEGKLPTGVPHRYPWTAAYLSLLFGAGQLYNRQPLKAAFFAIGQIAWWVAFVVTILSPWSDVVALLLVFWHLYMMADGFIIAAKINGDPWRFRHLVAIWFALMFMLGAVLFLGQFFGHGLFYLTTVTSNSLAPGIRRGDKVFVLSSLVYRPLPKPGAVVYYNPARYTVVKPRGFHDDTFMVNEQSSFGVVTAGPNEVVSWTEGGPIKVNGNPVPPRLLPINPFGVPGTMELHIPPKHVGVLMTHSVSDALIDVMGVTEGGVGTPAEEMRAGHRVEEYDKAVMVARPEDVKDVKGNGAFYGVVLFRYYPPTRRRWFGFDGGLWEEYPAGYPKE